MKITYKQFIEAVENCVEYDLYVTRDIEELKIIEEVFEIDFNNFKDEELRWYLFGLKDMCRVEKEKYRYFDDEED
jgi:hypothetical protein